MELRNITTFSKVAENKSFSKAANLLNYSQAAVTIQIKQLEEELGLKLFDRVGKSINLTPKGREFLEYSHKIIDLSNQAINAMKSDKTPRGELRVGVVESFCTSQFPDIIKECSESYPEVELIVKIATTPELEQMLLKNEVDLIVTLDNKIQNKNLTNLFEQRENICFISSPDYPLSKEVLLLKDIINEPFIMPEKVCNCRKLLEHRISEFMNPEDLKIFLEIGNTEVIKKFVQQGVGISILPSMTHKQEIQNGSLKVLKVTDFQPDVWLQLVLHKDKYHSSVIESVTSVIISHLNS